MSIYKAKNFVESLKFATNGIICALKTQRNLKIHFIIALLILILSYLLKLEYLEWSVIIFCIVLMIFSELINTVVEAIIDVHYGDEYSHIAKNAKDVAAGAVLICAIGVAVVGTMIFLPKMLLLLN
ncbi:MAG: diacylglycerol kinase family protein [Cyanobacteriota bacterium]